MEVPLLLDRVTCTFTHAVKQVVFGELIMCSGFATFQEDDVDIVMHHVMGVIEFYGRWGSLSSHVHTMERIVWS